MWGAARSASFGSRPIRSPRTFQWRAARGGGARNRAALRDALGVPSDALLAMGLGYADLRKGFDLFLQVWRLAHAAGAFGLPVHLPA